MTNKKDKSNKKNKINTLPISLRSPIERQQEIRPIIEKLSELQLTAQYESVQKIMKVFSLFIKDGGSFDINIPFPEVNKRFKGLLTDNKKYEIWVKLEHLQ
jgi:hypothetical protein